MRLPAVLITVLVALAGCSTGSSDPAPPGVVAHAVNPAFVRGTDRGSVDQLAATAVTSVQEFWRQAFPANFGKPWRDLAGGFYSVDTTRPGSPPPPCAGDATEVEGNAFYCGTVDALAWDRAALLPVLKEHYGEAAVVMVLAHEFGHVVQQRTGFDVAASEPVLTEAMADCYSGSFIRWAADGHSHQLRISKQELDNAMRALTIFRDPVGQGPAKEHGTAFDRAAAFQDGYRSGAAVCARMSPTNRRFTSRELVAPQHPNQRLDQVLSGENAAAQGFFSGLVNRAGGQWPNPVTQRLTDQADRCAPGLVTYCSQPPTLLVDGPATTKVNRDYGDQASATLLASRSALAALSALHRPVAGPAASWQLTCLTGAYTGSRFGRDSAASMAPGDLDEAVGVLLGNEDVSRDVSGMNTLTGFDRFAAFRVGVLAGPSACGL